MYGDEIGTYEGNGGGFGGFGVFGVDVGSYGDVGSLSVDASPIRDNSDPGSAGFSGFDSSFGAWFDSNVPMLDPVVVKAPLTQPQINEANQFADAQALNDYWTYGVIVTLAGLVKGLGVRSAGASIIASHPP